MTWDKFVSIIMLALANYQVKFIVFAVAADVIANVIVSLVTGEFRLGYIANFLKSKLIPYLTGYVCAALLASVQPDLQSLPGIIWAFIEVSLVGDALAAIKKLGVPIPDALTKPKDGECC